MGITVLHSSGDYGVAGYDNVCLDVPGTSGGFSPSFPGTCPYVTSVGATQIDTGATVCLAPLCMLNKWKHERDWDCGFTDCYVAVTLR